MKLVIAGGRDITDMNLLVEALNAFGKLGDIKQVVSGMAPGVDTLGHQWATKCGIPVKEFPADWDRLGRAAGPIRNKEMAIYSDMLLAIWDGKSRGTKNMIDHMNRLKKPVYIHFVK